jgi:murein DD-endopeptidase MepM/ murein hydrolase activator NlpD
VLLGTLLGLALCGRALWRAPAGTSSSGGGLLFPVPGGSREGLAGGFMARRGEDRHAAVDILAPRGTPVLAVCDGTLERLSTSSRGGRGLYLRARSGGLCYYYAHLDRYSTGLGPGLTVYRGQVLGYVGSSGNAPADAPHLHLAVLRTEGGQPCAGGTPVDPYPLLARSHRPTRP